MGGKGLRSGFSAVLLLIMLSPAFIDVMPETPPATGTWYITGDEILENGTYYVNDSWVITDGASLTVRNCSLYFDQNNSYGIDVNNTGRLLMVNSNLNFPGRIYINGNASFSGCKFFEVALFFEQSSKGDCADCFFDGNNRYDAGILIQSQGISVTRCIFEGCIGDCVDINIANVIVADCAFYHTSQDYQDRPEWNFSGPIPSPPEADAIWLANNSFIDDQTGIHLIDQGMGNGYTPSIAIECSYSYNLWSYQNLFVGFTIAIDLFGSNNDACIANNSFTGCGIGIDAEETVTIPNIEIYDNRLENGTNGIIFESGDYTISRNSISNCSSDGIYSDFHPIDPGRTIITENTISSCAHFGVSVESYYTVSSTFDIRNNSISDCGGNAYDGAGIYARSDGGSFQIAGNALTGNTIYGMSLYGDIAVENNTIHNSTVGIRLQDSLTQSKLYFNIIFNATTGISLDCQADVEQNDIGNVYTGITLIPSAYTVDSATISANSIHTLGIGIDISDLSNSGKRSFIENNVIAAGGDGIRSEMASVQVTGNDFGGTSGYCVHAIGEAPVLNANDWGARCRGRLLQEWYLTMSAFESSDPYGGGLWTAATDFEGTVKDPSGHLVFSGHSGDSPSIRANLTGFTDDRDGNRTWATDYFVTLMKPHTGAGSGEIVFVNNTDFQQDLWPRADLAVEDLALPEGRPRPGQTVPVEVTVVEDNTYDNAFKPFRRVQVLLSDGVFTIGEKTMDEVEPNSTATIDFAWYATGGIHTLTAVVDPNQFLAEAFEDNNALSREVSVNSPPEAVLDVSDTNPSVGQTVTFCSNRSTDDVGVARSLFDFGDGMDSGWTADSVVLHAYDRPGTFYAALKVADAEGAESELQIAPAIVVAPGPFGVSLTANASVLDTLVPVTLTAIVNGTYGVRARYLWDFGDGTSEAGVNASQVEHVFSRAGAFVVSLSVTGASGGNGTAETALTVRDRPPVADFSLLPQDPTVLTPVRFSSQSGDPDGVIVKWLWDFGDGGQSLEPSPTHLYTAHGNFTVTLTVQDDSGNWATVAAKVVRVRDLPPAAHARASATRISAGGTVRLDASMTVDPDDSASTLLFRWSSDDGWASTGESVVRQFERPGKYELTLTVTDGDGASSQDRVSVEVLPSNNTEPVQYRPLAVGLFAVAASLFGLSALLLKMARASKGKRL